MNSRRLNKKTLAALGGCLILLLILSLVGILVRRSTKGYPQSSVATPQKSTSLYTDNPLSIVHMRRGDYPGSNIVIDQQLPSTASYDQYIASYQSEGLKIYALLTIPHGEKPKTGWPVIVFNHGYIPPTVYRTTERYIAYVDAFARNGYIVFKPDYRGNGNSQGSPEGTYYSPAYTTDDLNAIASIKKYKDADANRVGVWGHSMGGNITLKDLVVRPSSIKAAVIWSGVVGSYTDIFNWHDPAYHPSPEELKLRNRGRSALVQKYGTPVSNPTFWNSIDPTTFVSDITAPVQLDVGEADEEVPASFSAELAQKLRQAGKKVELYTYPGSDHNISQGFDLAMQRSLAFFDTYLKGGD